MSVVKDKTAEALSDLIGHNNSNNVSRATSPGEGPCQDHELHEISRSRPRTYQYGAHLPYEVESEDRQQQNLTEIINNLYLAVEGGDFAPGALHWTRELRSWLTLKFDPTKEQRIKLVRLYYDLCLAPGLEVATSERFASMFMFLIKRKHYLKPVRDLCLDWRPLFRELKVFVLPSESGLIHAQVIKRNYRTLTKLCTFAQLYFDPAEIPAMFEEFLPYFNTSFIEGAFVTIGLFSLMFPTAAPSEDIKSLQPQYYLPTFFHLWSLVNRSKVFDATFVGLFSRIARDALPNEHVPFSKYGVFTQEQSALLFTALLRLLEIPVGQSTSTYSATVDAAAGLGLMLERDPKKHPIGHQVARWIIMSLSPACLDGPDSVLSNLEGLVQAVETFFHPSNSGTWTRTLAQLVFYLADFFVMRWNREQSGEMKVPADRRLNDELKKRFVLCLRDVVFMGIYTKSGTAMNFFLSSLHSLAYLEPALILPGALQRIYPSMQGLVEVHRTTSSMRALQVLSRTMVCTKGFRCHVTTLLGLALPGIDANDLDKTMYTLSYIQSVCYNLPLHDLTRDRDDVAGSALAAQWVTSEMERMDQEGANLEIDYETNLSDEDEGLIVRSSTANLAEFLSSFLGRVFTLLENLPDAARLRSGSPEENVINTLPSTFTPMVGSLSPDLYDLALNKTADFISNHVIHQARDAMAFICNSFCKVHPEKALRRLIPVLISSIRTEIDENGAGSTRNAGTDVLPRDRGLLWHLSMLSMCVVHVGDALLPFKRELLDIGVYMQEKCKGSPAVHVSNYIHHLLVSLVGIYTMDYSPYEANAQGRALGPADWGYISKPDELTIKWHTPNAEEIDFAYEIFRSQAETAIQSITSLISPSSPIKRESKAWSDDLSKDLTLIRLLLAGIGPFFDPKETARSPGLSLPARPDGDTATVDAKGSSDDESDNINSALAIHADDEARPTFAYPVGYPLKRDDLAYRSLHDIRAQLGRTLHAVHDLLILNKEDDLSCFTILYSAYKSWFIDVGVEKTAHSLDRVTRLFTNDAQPYKISGLRKRYPRAILLRRAYVYHLQRLRHNAFPRPASELEKQLLLDLARSSVSLYTDVRRSAQNAIEAAAKSILGVRPLLVPSLVKEFEQAVKETDLERIQGSMHVLLFGTLAKTIGKDWRYAPRVIRTYLAACHVDNPSVQRLCSTGIFTIMEFGRSSERMVILDRAVVRAIAPAELGTEQENRIRNKREELGKKHAAMESRKAKLSEELVDMTRNAHWKTASRTAAIVVTLGLRFTTLASENLVDLLVQGTIDSHPGLRGLFSGAMIALFSLINTRVACEHDFQNYLLDKQKIAGKVEIATRREEPDWTAQHLASFTKPDTAHYVDHQHPGWLVWGAKMPGYESDIRNGNAYDHEETRVIDAIGKSLHRGWFASLFGYLLQEPRDSATDRYRVSTVILLKYALGLVLDGHTATTFDEIKHETETAFGDGGSKHEHRALAEILGGLLGAALNKSLDIRGAVWGFCIPKILRVFSDQLTPENSGYWTSFVHMIYQGNDPRRSWPLLEWLAGFRLDMSSNAAFKESSKMALLETCILGAGWHFRLEGPVLSNFLDHLDHPYKGVREAMGGTIAAIYRTRYHESYSSVDSLMSAQREASSVGTRPYQPSEQFSKTIHDIFDRLERWRQDRTPGQQTPSSYTSASKTVLLWLDITLASFDCTQLLPFFPDVFMEQLLHMMDVKEDQELQSLAYYVFRHLPNIPHPMGEDADMIGTLIRIGRTSPFWHQRLRILISIQIIYFRRLFVMSNAQQKDLFDCIAFMLNDSQLEVRMGAMSTLSGMIRCSRAAFRDRTIETLSRRFTEMLLRNPLPKKPRGAPSNQSTGTSTPTPEHTRLVITRHAAVLGLGALVQAFPYTSPPPGWIPGVLTTLANKANSDPGVVGKSVKSILSDFKKTRQDTWQMDLKAFSPDQVEDLEGVLWKSYFA